MARMRCEFCGRFMAKTDYEGEAEFDEELARSYGHTEEEIDAGYSKWSDLYWSRFSYMVDVYECDECGTLQSDENSPRYYYDPTTNSYTGQPPKRGEDIPY